jgi:putative endonuclease
MFFVYVLQSQKDGTTYIGKTEHLDKRLKEHNQGKTKSIKHKLPMELVYYEAYLTKRLAGKREYELKSNSWSKEKLFERIFD